MALTDVKYHKLKMVLIVDNDEHKERLLKDNPGATARALDLVRWEVTIPIPLKTPILAPFNH